MKNVTTIEFLVHGSIKSRFPKTGVSACSVSSTHQHTNCLLKHLSACCRKVKHTDICHYRCLGWIMMLITRYGRNYRDTVYMLNNSADVGCVGVKCAYCLSMCVYEWIYVPFKTFFFLNYELMTCG